MDDDNDAGRVDNDMDDLLRENHEDDDEEVDVDLLVKRLKDQVKSHRTDVRPPPSST